MEDIDGLLRSVMLSLATHRMFHSPRKLGVYGLTQRMDLKMGSGH